MSLNRLPLLPLLLVFVGTEATKFPTKFPARVCVIVASPLPYNDVTISDRCRDTANYM